MKIPGYLRRTRGAATPIRVAAGADGAQGATADAL